MLSHKHSPEALLADESFINFCKQSVPADTEKWRRYAGENEDQRLQVEAAKKLFTDLFSVLAADDLAEQESILKRKLLASAEPSAIAIKEETNKRRPVWLYWSGYAAALLLVIVGAYFLIAKPGDVKEERRSFSVGNGERKSFQLADGSLITLNAGSKISIGAAYGTADRNIFLEGEAFFDVKHNTTLPFVVHTPALDIKALGTAFNVKAYPGENISEASLIRGLVEVTLNQDNDRKLLLHPNQKVQWDEWKKDNVATPRADPQNKAGDETAKRLIQPLKKTEEGDIKEVAWTANKLVFDNETFSGIAAVFERWYSVKINFTDDEVRNIRFTGTFQKEELKTILDFWKESKGFHYTIVPGNTTVINIAK